VFSRDCFVGRHFVFNLGVSRGARRCRIIGSPDGAEINATIEALTPPSDPASWDRHRRPACVSGWLKLRRVSGDYEQRFVRRRANWRKSRKAAGVLFSSRRFFHLGLRCCHSTWSL